MKTFVEILRTRAREEPHACAFAFLTSDGGETRITYSALEEQARALAARLQRSGAAGERVLIVLPPGLDYVVAVLGCLFAGSTAVPCALPSRMERARQLPAIAIDSGAKFAVGRSFSEHLELAHLEWIAADAIDIQEAGSWQEPRLTSELPALLQYTSGTTSSPRGVMVSHANLLANAEAIAAGFKHPKPLWGVTWLPPYHDMGLMGGILQPIYFGSPSAVISPLDFVRRPVVWLEAVSRYGVRTSGGPNFAYELCARTISLAEAANLRLDSWELAYVGAEPVRVDTLNLFADKFAALGFRRESFFPCYGLAEATLYVSGGRPSVRCLSASGMRAHRVLEISRPEPLADDDADAHAIVGCGRPAAALTVSIVDPVTSRRCETGSIGEIWVSGPTVASGYWRRPEETHDTFLARLAEDGDGPFLRTGDLGFMQDGDLFVTGRFKELIIVRGRNHYPQDIEHTVLGISPAIRPGTCAAFSVDSGSEERLVLILEMPRPRPERLDVLAGDIRQAVVAAHELQVSALVLVRPGAIPRTSSGKPRRLECRTQYISGALEPVTTV